MSPGTGYIRADTVWKRFRRGQVHDSLRDLLPALSRRLVRGSTDLQVNEFWALRDLSFEVLPGQALGIMGPNGAGKSTALKILTRILRPNHGAVEVRGRVGAMIEVSAGFHPDLTGRENVFLQGSIMGMPLDLIRKRFDEIVEFSGIGEFLDTPVKRYSSGMTARLGFSIAAHLSPDVLIVDEVLAVGDFRYQDKAFGRIRELVTSGIPVVIVSHQLDRIASLCTDAIVLDRGSVAFRGTPSDAISWYLSGERGQPTDGDSGCGIRLNSLKPTDTDRVDSGERLAMVLEGSVDDAELAGDKTVVVKVRSVSTGQIIFAAGISNCGVRLPSEGPFRVRIDLEMNTRPGVYAIEPYIVYKHNGRVATGGAGPLAYAQVQEDPNFQGTVQLKPRMALENGSDPS